MLRQGKPSLRDIQRRVQLQNRHRIKRLSLVTPVNLMIFDLPSLKREPLMAKPWWERRERLRALMEQIPVPGALVPGGVREYGRQFFREIVQLGLEGIVAKHVDGPYLPAKRCGYWLKVKVKGYDGKRE